MEYKEGSAMTDCIIFLLCNRVIKLRVMKAVSCCTHSVKWIDAHSIHFQSDHSWNHIQCALNMKRP